MLVLSLVSNLHTQSQITIYTFEESNWMEKVKKIHPIFFNNILFLDCN